MIDPTDVEANQLDQAERTKREQAAREVERSELKRILGSELGRSFVMRLIERAGLFRLSFPVNAPEATHLMAFSEGRRNEGLSILNDILESCPELWQVMLRERAARKAKEQTE